MHKTSLRNAGALLGLDVEAERIYVDHGLTGTNRERPGLREALAACRAGDTPGGHQARPPRPVASPTPERSRKNSPLDRSA
ncbi:recombinase family protein [Nocardioides sp. B-3]|uniref:recombinase family protein n=1 Tax=Nocardioides sp. B-3 TaxID=2895565 RepID=UPI00215363F3|nr:recombinase family protein [Nocardioides sp. B-3]UUZ59887.1 recombinase family protein [Nocardioides sp. B-3]